MGTLNPDPASPARLEARLADAGARSRSRNGAPSPYGLMSSPAAHMLPPPQRAVQGAGRCSGARPLPSYGTSVQRPSRASQPRARFPTQFPVHQQVHQPRARQGRSSVRHVEHFPQRAAPHHGHGHGHGHGSESSYLHHQLPPRPVQPQTTDRPQTADPSAALDTEEYQAAFSELDELRGLAAADPKDAGRFEAAARPMTAPSAPLEVPAEYLQAAAPARPGTSAGRVETEEELRVRLLAAESVMRKLYRRNSQLEEQQKEQQRPATSGGLVGRDAGPSTPDARPQTSAGVSAGVPGAAPEGEEGEGEGGGIGMSAANEHALYLLRQKESDLQRMKEYTAGLHAQLTEATALGATNNPTAATATAAAAAEANAEYRERYMRMRGEYRQLLRSRADSLKRSSRSTMDREQQALLGQMETALQDEADLHRSESQRLNEELYLQEKRQCDWYVEKHTLQQQMGGMQQELAQRDELDGEIESKMAALFSRMKRLEDENIQLAETNEVLRNNTGANEAAANEAAANEAAANEAAANEAAASTEASAGAEPVR